MSTINRERDREDEPGEQGAGGPAPRGELPAIQRRAPDLLSAGREAIDKALSGNSQAFLRASKQSGGE